MAVADDARELHDLLHAGVTSATAFLAVYRFIDSTDSGRFGWLRLGEQVIYGPECDSLIVDWRTRLRESVDSDSLFDGLEVAGLGATLDAIAASGTISRENSKDLVVALRVLDAAFRGVHIAEVSSSIDSLGFVRLRTRLRKGEPLFEGGELKVYPKPKRLAQVEVRGQARLSDLLDVLTVLRVSPHLRVVYDSMFGAAIHGPEGFQKIGLVPTIHVASELAWSHELNHRYSIRESAAMQDAVHTRVRSALDLLLANGADLILLPELVSGPELVTMLKDYLRDRQLAGQPNPALVLAGTQMADDDGLKRNRAVVLDSWGDVAWHQDKMHAYCFTADEQVKARLPLGNDDLVDRLEDIDLEPRVLTVVDLSPSQRVVVLTCEDFAQDLPHRSAVSDICATTLLVPIMAVGRESHRVQGWITDAAMNYVRHPGATSIVANSAALVEWRGTLDEWWNFGEIRSSPRLNVAWEGLVDVPGTPPIAWLATLARMV